VSRSDEGRLQKGMLPAEDRKWAHQNRKMSSRSGQNPLDRHVRQFVTRVKSEIHQDIGSDREAALLLIFQPGREPMACQAEMFNAVQER
jgi:hypothetical protein